MAKKRKTAKRNGTAKPPRKPRAPAKPKGKTIRMRGTDDSFGAIGIAGKKRYKPDASGIYFIAPADVAVCLRSGLKLFKE